jgi:hypothetical protein
LIGDAGPIPLRPDVAHSPRPIEYTGSKKPLEMRRKSAANVIEVEVQLLRGFYIAVRLPEAINFKHCSILSRSV